MGGGGGIYRGAKKFFALGICVEEGRVRLLVRVHERVLVCILGCRVIYCDCRNVGIFIFSWCR